jgi:hypothetical protein
MASHVPMLPEWEQWLWKEGQKEVLALREDDDAYTCAQTLIGIQTGHSCRYATVSTNKHAWVQIIRRHFDLTIILKAHKEDRWYETKAYVDTRDPDNGFKLQYDSKEMSWFLFRSNEPILNPEDNTPCQGHRPENVVVAAHKMGFGLSIVTES